MVEMDGTEQFSLLREWIGRREAREEFIAPAPAVALAATLDHDVAPGAGEPLPPLWHWLYFLPQVRQSEIGVDGHPRRGGFLPPVPLPRRMWAAGRLEFRRPIVIGTYLRRESTIADVQHKRGRSGDLVFVTVRHELYDESRCVISEEQQIVYRGMVGGNTLSSPPEALPAAWKGSVATNPVLLFRYSALTFNAHRIHYDRPYATEVEGYPGLVVHGPLIATLVLDGFARAHPDAPIRGFRFRAQRPLYEGRDIIVGGESPGGAGSCRVWASDSEGHRAMDAEVAIGPDMSDRDLSE
jgi:3-methylfumaryl-CoA hydratase